MKFSPRDKQDIQIAEVDPIQILNLAMTNPGVVPFEYGGKTYQIQLNSQRYKLFAKSRVCACCGVVGNRMFLDPITDEKHRENVVGDPFHFNLYAETKDGPDRETHLALMTKDHIVPRRKGGSDEIENCQTLCWLCNSYRDFTDLSIKQIQDTLFIAYRIYRGSFTNRKAREKLETLQRYAEGLRRAIQSIDEGMMKAAEERRPGMLATKAQKQETLEKVTKHIDSLILEAQTTGVVPDDSQVSYEIRSSR